MSAELAVRGAVLAALRGSAALMDILNGAYDGPPVKASEPYAVIGECIGGDWGTKDRAGCELRLSLAILERMETPARLAEVMSLADAAVRGVSGVIDGWRIATVALIRSRTMRARDQGWSCVIDYRFRVLRESD